MVSLLIGLIFVIMVITPFLMFWEGHTDNIDEARYFNNKNLFAPFRYCCVYGDRVYLEPKQKGDFLYCEGAKREYISIGEITEMGYHTPLEWAEANVRSGQWIEVTRDNWRTEK